MATQLTLTATPGVLSGLSVLVVDDHGDSLHRLVALLQAAGAIVVGVRTPKAAIDYAKLARFDAVIVDLTMEEGAWLLRQVGESPTLSATTRVFAVTGERHDQSYRERFAGYFLKPINRHIVIAGLAALPRRPN